MSAPELGAEQDYDVGAVRSVLEALRYTGDVDKVAEGLTDPTVVIAWRLEPSGSHVRLFEMDTGEFQALGAGWEYIQRTYGAGKYRVDVQRTRGASPLLASMTLRLAAAAGAPPAQPPGTNGATPELEHRLERLERMLERMLERGASGAAAPAPGFFDAVASVSKAMSEQNAPLLKAIIEMKAGGAERGPGPDKMLEIFMRGVELARETGGGGGEGFGGALRELLPSVMGELRALRGGAPGAPALPPGGGAPPSSSSSPELEGPAPAGAPTWALVLRPHVPFLLQLAGMRADPEHWAEQVTGQVDPERLTFIEDQLQRGHVFREEFFVAFPDAMGHRSWFEMFFDALAGQLRELRELEAGDELEGPPTKRP